MRTWITIFCLGALVGCFEEETQKPVLGTNPSHPLRDGGGIECYDPALCEPTPFDAGVPECFVDDGGFTSCPQPLDAGFPECFLDDAGFTVCPVPEDAGIPECFLDDAGFTVCPTDPDAGAPECVVDEAGLVHCPTSPDAGTPECFEPDGTPCGERPDAGFDPYA